MTIPSAALDYGRWTSPGPAQEAETITCNSPALKASVLSISLSILVRFDTAIDGSLTDVSSDSESQTQVIKPLWSDRTPV